MGAIESLEDTKTTLTRAQEAQQAATLSFPEAKAAENVEVTEEALREA